MLAYTALSGMWCNPARPQRDMRILLQMVASSSSCIEGLVIRLPDMSITSVMTSQPCYLGLSALVTQEKKTFNWEQLSTTTPAAWWGSTAVDIYGISLWVKCHACRKSIYGKQMGRRKNSYIRRYIDLLSLGSRVCPIKKHLTSTNYL